MTQPIETKVDKDAGYTKGNMDWLRQLRDDPEMHSHFFVLWVLVDQFVNRKIYNEHRIRVAFPSPEFWAQIARKKVRTIQYGVEAAVEAGYMLTVRRGRGRATAYVLIKKNTQDPASFDAEKIRKILRMFTIDKMQSNAKRHASASPETRNDVWNNSDISGPYEHYSSRDSSEYE
jgi:hypothetical protein